MILPHNSSSVIFNLKTQTTAFFTKRAKDIWNLTYEGDFRGSFVDRWIRINSHSSLGELELVAVTCWSICNDRNKVIHGEAIPTLKFRSKWILDYLKNYRRSNSREAVERINFQRSDSVAQSSPTCWFPPQSGFWKLNTDVACLPSPPTTGVGSICRNSNGEVLIASTKNLDFCMEAIWLNYRPFKMD